MPVRSDTIKVMTFNLRYASANDGDNNWQNAGQSPDRRRVAVMVITNRAPDVIGFQEGEDVQLDYLAANLPAHYAFQRQKPSGGGGNENAAFAYNTNVVQLLDRGVFSLGPKPGGGYWNNVAGTPLDPWSYFAEVQYQFPRLALWGKFKFLATGQEFLFYTTHFDVFNSTYNGESQVKSAELLVRDAFGRDDLLPSSLPAIVVGDFNGSQNDRAWQLFTGALTYNGVTGDFTDSWWQTHGTWLNAGTFHGFAGGTISGNSRIDWILHRGGFIATQCEIVTDFAVATGCPACPRNQYSSDHYPVIATLQLPAAVDRHPASLFDVRRYLMDGLRDYRATLLASNGLELWWRFDGRYLYVATQDAGEGNDNFIFITRNPDAAVSAPWAKAGQVAPWDAFLADENNNDFSGWFNATGQSATYYTNGGWLEGVIDLSQIYGVGFTGVFYLAAAPYATADGGALIASVQVPAGNGDGNLTGTNEFVRIDPLAGVSTLQVTSLALSNNFVALSWPASFEHIYTVWRADAASFSAGLPWVCIHTNTFGIGDVVVPQTTSTPGTFFKVRWER